MASMQTYAMNRVSRACLIAQIGSRRVSSSRAPSFGAGRPIPALLKPAKGLRLRPTVYTILNAATLERSDVQRPSVEAVQRYEAQLAVHGMAVVHY